MIFQVTFEFSAPANLKIGGISDAGTPQPERDLDAEIVLVKLNLDTCNS